MKNLLNHTFFHFTLGFVTIILATFFIIGLTAQYGAEESNQTACTTTSENC